MKKFYESAEISIVMFNAVDVIVASSVDEPTTTIKPSNDPENDETEIL